MAHKAPSLASHGYQESASDVNWLSTSRRLFLIAALGILSLLIGLIAGLSYENPMLTGTIIGLMPRRYRYPVSATTQNGRPMKLTADMVIAGMAAIDDLLPVSRR